LITVITVVLNGAKTLEETIQSVINQTYPNVEYIIIDGGSTDGTLDIIKKHENYIDYWVSEKDGGIYDAMNKGIDLVNGEFVNFMNSGDLFYNNSVLHTVCNELDDGMIYGNHALYGKNMVKVIDVKNYKDKRNIPFCHQALFVKSFYLKKNKFNRKYNIASDYDQYLSLKYSGIKIKHIPETICLYLEGGLSQVDRKRLIYEYYQVMKKYKPFYALIIKIIRLVKYYILRK